MVEYWIKVHFFFHQSTSPIQQLQKKVHLLNRFTITAKQSKLLDVERVRSRVRVVRAAGLALGAVRPAVVLQVQLVDVGLRLGVRLGVERRAAAVRVQSVQLRRRIGPLTQAKPS